jgi:hypothetical protein
VIPRQSGRIWDRQFGRSSKKVWVERRVVCYVAPNVNEDLRPVSGSEAEPRSARTSLIGALHPF